MDSLQLTCPKINEFLIDGLRRNVIYELTGEAGTGKTQFCVHLALCNSIVNNGNNSANKKHGCLYFYTYGQFPITRYMEMRKEFQKNYNIVLDETLYVILIKNLDHLMSTLQSDLKRQIEEHNIGLIILDSITPLIVTIDNYYEREDNFKTILNLVLGIERRHNCVIVCVNEMRAHIEDIVEEKDLTILNEFDEFVSWKNESDSEEVEDTDDDESSQETHVIDHTNTNNTFSKFRKSSLFSKRENPRQLGGLMKPCLNSLWSRFATYRLMLSKAPQVSLKETEISRKLEYQAPKLVTDYYFVIRSTGIFPSPNYENGCYMGPLED